MEKLVVIEGMHCQSCIKKVTKAFLSHNSISNADVKLSPEQSKLTINKPITDIEIDHIVAPLGYSWHENKASLYSKIKVYYPLFLAFLFLLATAVTLSIRFNGNMVFFMHSFMGGFFLLFSFLKFLNLKGFMNSFAEYDILAKRSKTYALIYPFIELILGLMYSASIFPMASYIITIVIMSLGLVGVISAVRQQKKIQCACMGTVFDLPMSQITIFENSLMILMAVMLLVINMN